MVRPADLDADGRGRLRRNEEADLGALRALLARESDEDRVTDAFRAWLLDQGWTLVEPTDRWTDLEAVRGEVRLICEAKGRTRRRASTRTSPTGSCCAAWPARTPAYGTPSSCRPRP
ncbi:hypothetical protein GCM10010297_00090 [Streptomyces malachitofuscus]|nr:hypothetical protein GCM10010297_00090 [Streptomyces malachitofuscus]